MIHRSWTSWIRFPFSRLSVWMSCVICRLWNEGTYVAGQKKKRDCKSWPGRSIVLPPTVKNVCPGWFQRVVDFPVTSVCMQCRRIKRQPIRKSKEIQINFRPVGSAASRRDRYDHDSPPYSLICGILSAPDDNFVSWHNYVQPIRGYSQLSSKLVLWSNFFFVCVWLPVTWSLHAISQVV